MTFGEFIKSQRMNLGLTLRAFSKKKKYDASYISRLENGLLLPPEDGDKLKTLAIALELKEGRSGWSTFFDLAAASHKSIPLDLVEDNPAIINFLPAFFRTARKSKVNKQDIKNLLKLLKGKI